MPKIKPLMWTATPQCDVLRKNIKICMVRSDINAEKLAKLLDVSRSTAYYKIKEPKKIEFEDLCKMANIFKVDLSDLVREGGV